MESEECHFGLYSGIFLAACHALENTTAEITVTDPPVAAAVRSHFLDCPDAHMNFCFHGTCRYLVQEEEPACVCLPGFAGKRCEHADLLAVVAASQKKNTITALVAVYDIQLMANPKTQRTPLIWPIQKIVTVVAAGRSTASGVDQLCVSRRNQMDSSKGERPAASQRQWSEKDLQKTRVFPSYGATFLTHPAQFTSQTTAGTHTLNGAHAGIHDPSQRQGNCSQCVLYNVKQWRRETDNTSHWKLRYIWIPCTVRGSWSVSSIGKTDATSVEPVLLQQASTMGQIHTLILTLPDGSSMYKSVSYRPICW
ncbi:protransforming growth factor alpha isoform X2 [Hyla sarda]|uniref:protransforming growth factor alpha isoform X2 n=1 Tax=Hyla sarda TaxID=327740 RepID=UPI0024C247D8|nr:protransforming growth factor alpha isoform X2 [Hyla sarda]